MDQTINQHTGRRGSWTVYIYKAYPLAAEYRVWRRIDTICTLNTPIGITSSHQLSLLPDLQFPIVNTVGLALRILRPSNLSFTTRSSMSDNATHKVIVGLDFGTTTCKAAYYAPRLLRVSSDFPTPSQFTPSEAEIYPVELSNEGHTEPTKLAWHKEKCRLFYGSELDREVNRGSIPPEDVIDLPKLSLDRSAQTCKLRKKQKAQREQIGDKNGKLFSSVDVIAQFLRWFKDRVLDRIKFQLDRRRYNVLTLADNTTWVLTLPANWEEASDDLRQAAREAGLGEVELVTETDAAAAAMLGSSKENFRELVRAAFSHLDLYLTRFAGSRANPCCRRRWWHARESSKSVVFVDKNLRLV